MSPEFNTADWIGKSSNTDSYEVCDNLRPTRKAFYF